MRQPLIGISAYSYIKPNNGWSYDISYAPNAAAIERSGGLPVLIPSTLDLETLRAIFERLDAVLLPGGGDVNPDQYHAPRGEILKEVDDLRDKMEIAMTRWSVDEDRPVMGICRGIQVMNVALGGTLVQDIPTHIATDLRHNIQAPDEPRSMLLHDVQLKDGTRLASILGEQQIAVNSVHHQALGNLAPGLHVTAVAPDGISEGVELPDRTFAMAVQWHPEDLIDHDARMQKLFDAFVQAARARMRP